ncbi:MAG: hypothetical protein WAN42_22050, partial [Pseudolabrys sp.]
SDPLPVAAKFLVPIDIPFPGPRPIPFVRPVQARPIPFGLAKETPVWTRQMTSTASICGK